MLSVTFSSIDDQIKARDILKYFNYNYKFSHYNINSFLNLSIYYDNYVLTEYIISIGGDVNIKIISGGFPTRAITLAIKRKNISLIKFHLHGYIISLLGRAN